MITKYLRNRFFLHLSDEKGIVLIAGLLIMIVLTIMGGFALFFTNREMMTTKIYEGNVQALYAAEAGAEKVYDAFMQGDTSGDGIVGAGDSPNSANDLDNNGIIDFTQVFTNKANIGSSANRITVNSGDTRAEVWIDASQSPALITIWSRGIPEGTNNQKEVALTLTTSGENIINGALNNSTPCSPPKQKMNNGCY
ncbi:MAG: hypothetical protein HY096_14280 [Nitrospinae bacterium]|nr:hypothetical protein [Nitrospinota bacterium]MBI5748237.1 hypothetical protein [Nitrospinota bacterium]